MLNVIKNELIKVFANKRIYIFMVILFIFSLIPCVGSLIFKNGAVIIGQMLAFNQLKSVLILMLPMFIIVLVSDMYTEEYSNGTLKLQMIHPVSRGKLLFSKMVTLAITLMILLLFSMVVGYVLGVAFFGWGNLFQVYGVMYSTGSGILLTFASYIISLIPMVAFGMLILLIELQFTSGGAAVGTSIGIFLILTYIGQLYESAKPYIINTYFDIYSLFIKNTDFKNIITYCGVIAIYGIASYGISHYLFKKKDILF